MITPAMRMVAKRLAYRHREDSTQMERRSDRRDIQNIEAVVVGLDSLYSPVGYPQQVVVQNLSPTGLGFVGSKEVRSACVVVQMEKPSERVQLIAEVKHSQLLKEGISQVGVQFIQRLGTNCRLVITG